MRDLRFPDQSARDLRRLVVLILLLASLTVRDVGAHPTHPGKWTAPSNPPWPAEAINLVLLPGWLPTHHSRVLWWSHDSHASVAGGLWGWNPPVDDSVNSGAFPSTSFVNLNLQDPPTVGGHPTDIFCAGQTMLADGRLLVTGGNELVEVGIRSALLFDPSADLNGEWATADSMAFRRWYPENTLLPDGRVVTVTGSSYAHFVSVAGIYDAAPGLATNLLQRIGAARPGQWEPSTVPTSSPIAIVDPPGPMHRFSDAGAETLDENTMFLFGGRDSLGNLSNTAYTVDRVDAPWASDYSFEWKRIHKHGQSDPAPPPRIGSAVVAIPSPYEVLVIGGKDESGASSKVWRGVVGPVTMFWHELTVQGTLPALHGHSAVYVPQVDRIFVFGGSTTGSETPTNPHVYSLRLVNASTVACTLATASGTTPPGPRSYGSLTLDPHNRRGMPVAQWEDSTRRRALLFGGHTVGGGLSDTLHALWIKSATEVVWDRITPDAGARPTGRAHHGAASDRFSSCLYLSGGETAPDMSSGEAWAFDLGCGASARCDLEGSNHWERLPDLPLAVRGHGTVVWSAPAYPRLPEVFDPLVPAVGNSWTTVTSAPHWQEWYSFGFAAPRRPGDPAGSDSLRVFYAGPEFPSSTLHMSRGTPNWTTLESASAGNFPAGSAVMYRPGKVMKCGSRDTAGDDASVVTGRTAAVDLNASTPAWTEAAPANRMISRRNHNLVALPTGEVLVVGGARYGPNHVSTDLNCVKMPQFWNPDTLTAGHWYGQERNASNQLTMRFDSSTVRRHYHSSAVLLPDARILVAGGAPNTEQHRLLADIYSPYYLFNGSQPALRPSVVSAPDSVAYGETFPLCMSPTGGVLAKASLVRPGATTHGFDQNQRFLWLNVTAAPQGGNSRFLVTAPADSFDAPPGDYMLFALTSSGTPSIAKWIRLRATGRTGRPSTINNLAKICSQGQTVQLQWTPPYGDSATALTCPGPAARYELRYKQGLMPGWAEFAVPPATSVSSMPLPNDPVPGQPQSISIGGLTENTQYTFRIVSKNFASGSGNWSALGNALTFTTISEQCGGSGGGGGGCCQEGGSARQARGSWLRRPIGSGSGSDPGYLENTLLASVPHDQSATDLLRLPYGPKWSTTEARVRLSRSGSAGTRFTRVRLIGVSVSAGQDAFTAGSAVLAGTLAPPLRVRHADGRDLTSSFAADTAFDGHPGDTLLVEFADPTAARLALESSGAHLVVHPARTGIEIQCETAQGWQTVAHHDPRALRSDALHEVPRAGRLRLVFRGDHRLHGVTRFIPGEPATVTAFEPTGLTHSSAGALGATLGQDGALLAPGEYMVAEFAVDRAQVSGFDWFLEVTGEHTAVSGSGTTSSRNDQASEAPLRFALEQNRPNPFEQETRIGFELPRRAAVRLEVYDLLGRRVAVLANATYEPGRHSVMWDRRGVKGTRVPAGVYTCRYTAGEHQEQRRMIVFP